MSPFLFILYSSDFEYDIDVSPCDESAAVRCIRWEDVSEHRRVEDSLWTEMNHLQLITSRTGELLIDF